MAEFENWLLSGYDCGTAIWNHYKVQCIKMNTPGLSEHLLNDIKKFVAESERRPSLEADTTNQSSIDVNSIQPTLCNVVQYAVKEKWLSGITTLADNTCNEVQGSTTLFKTANFPDTLKSLLYNCCEE